MIEVLLEQAIHLIKAGKTDQGGRILARLLKEDPGIERAWVWLVACVKTDEQRIYCLRRVLNLNPSHKRAQVALKKLEARIPAHTPEPLKSDLKPEPVAETKVYKIRRIEDFKSKGENALRIDSSTAKNNKVKPNPLKIIFVKPEENPFSEPAYEMSDFPEESSGLYGTSLLIGGIKINAREQPECVEFGRPLSKERCYVCEFFSEEDCPLRKDFTVLKEVSFFFAQNKRYWKEYHEQREEVIEAIYQELKAHGRALHYEILTQIVKDRYPKLRITPFKVVRLMGNHAERFEWVDEGVYRAK